MKKTILCLLLVVTTAATTYAEDPLLTFHLLKWKTRTKKDNGEYGAWKNHGKSDYAIAIYGGLNGTEVIKFIHIQKRLLVKTYTYTSSTIEVKDDIQYMTFNSIDNYGEPLQFIVSHYPADASLSTAKWVKINMVYEKSEYEYEARFMRSN